MVISAVQADDLAFMPDFASALPMPTTIPHTPNLALGP